MSRYYIIRNGVPVETNDVILWGRYMESADRHIALDEFEVNGQKVKVSTVFLGLDHSWQPGGPPVLWETMIFGGPESEFQDRYTSEAEARVGHAAAVKLAKSHEKEIA